MSDDLNKRNEALKRAMPISRMIDYGLHAALAQAIHEEVGSGARWEDVLLARSNAARSEGDGFTSAVAMNFAQMASNFDTPDRVALFRLALQEFTNWAALSPKGPNRFQLGYRGGQIFGWDFPADKASAPTVMLVGGMSGWATSFVGMARALNAMGLRCLLLDGPGQGETRINGGLLLQNGYPGAIRVVVDNLVAAGCASIGIWGNSMGGLLAAAAARDDDRIGACCINGAPSVMAFPDFRTAREQMAAMFGLLHIGATVELTEVAETLQALSFEAGARPLRCPVLVCEGGADPLVPLGSQRAFLTDNPHESSSVLSWADGEHTIYNHAAERSVSVSAWFHSVLSAH